MTEHHRDRDTISEPEQLSAGLEEIIKDIGIPPRPVILEHIAAEIQKPEPDFNHVAQLINRDVGLAAGLVKTVNAPYFGLRKKVRTVREALLLLGLAAVARTVAGLALRRAFPPGPSLERFWDASDRTAQLSGWLVYELGARYGVRHEDAYTYALFRDCGIPILLRRFPNYKSILAEANAAEDGPFTQIEEIYLPTHHALIGSLMSQGWWLPEITSLAIRHHHDMTVVTTTSSILGEASKRLIAVAQLAEFLFQGATNLSGNREWRKLGPACLSLLELDERHLPPLALRAAAFLDSIDPI